MGRKNLLVDLVESKLTAVNFDVAHTASAERETPQPTLGSRGAVGAMSRSLEIISAEREAAKALSTQMASGQNLIEIDTVLLDASIVPDRMKGPDEDHAALVESLRVSGQLVPILVRPHPELPGRFQIAYGHRRVRGLAELGRPARAIVRDLSDEDLVVAQGKENSERKDLSYIERSTYAIALDDRGFGRETIMVALSVDKTELSRLISVGRAIPRHLADAIGPAPKTGRRRWLELSERLSGKNAERVIFKCLQDEKFRSSGSDTRFALLYGALQPRHRKESRATVWTDEDGRKVAHIERMADRVTLSVNEKTVPNFGEFLIDSLPELYRTFCERRGGG